MRANSRLYWIFLIAAVILVPLAEAKAACGESVTVYALKGCPYCAKAEQLLSENGVRYERIEADNQDVLSEMEEKYGADTVPIVVVDGLYVVGYDEAWIRQNLCLKNTRTDR